MIFVRHNARIAILTAVNFLKFAGIPVVFLDSVIRAHPNESAQPKCPQLNMEEPIYLQDFTETAFSTTSLESMERLDRASPELWPEQVPGIQEFVPRAPRRVKKPEWMSSFNNEDAKLLVGLSKMSPPVLIQEVKKLYDAAYQLGLDESREMTRGMYLKVLQSTDANAIESNRPNGS